jgi:hypothetical protein
MVHLNGILSLILDPSWSLRDKEDAILENAEMQIAEGRGAQETIPVLEQNMKDEQSMAKLDYG